MALLLALVLLNLPPWFRESFCPRQWASWILLAASAAMAGTGFRTLIKLGRPRGHIDRTTVFVVRGVYRFIRHPLYASLILLAWGVQLKETSPSATVLALAATVLIFVMAKVEEGENRRKFGAAYARYVRRSRMFVPFIV